MIKQRPCVNGILAAVLSASFLPMHGALAKEPTAPAAKHAVKKSAKPAAAKTAPADAAPASGTTAPDATGAVPAEKPAQ